MNFFNSKTPDFGELPRVLVIGGGLAGLACARSLKNAGLQVRILDKGRGAGGRVSTRRMDGLAFDHGAQYFTARDPRFRTYVESWRREGVVRLWQGRIGTLVEGRRGETQVRTERFVGVPGMSAIGRHLAQGLDLSTGVRVVALERLGDVWHARDAGGRAYEADLAVLAMPAPQTLALMPAQTEIAERVAAVEMAPCWAVMAAFEEPLAIDLDGAFVSESALSWVARNTSKPGRPASESWVLHAGPEWSAEHRDVDPDEICDKLLEAFSVAAGVSLPTVEKVVAHRWLYARASRPLGQESLFDRESNLAVCGDWCPGARVEGAFLSGLGAAREVLSCFNAVIAKKNAEADATRHLLPAPLPAVDAGRRRSALSPRLATNLVSCRD